MTAFILNFGQKDTFAFERGRAGEPVTLGLHTHYFGVGVLGDLANEILAVALRHPIFRFDLFLSLNFDLEILFELGLWFMHLFTPVPRKYL